MPHGNALPHAASQPPGVPTDRRQTDSPRREADDDGPFSAAPPMHWDDWQLDADADQLQMLLQQFDALVSADPACGGAPPATGRTDGSQAPPRGGQPTERPPQRFSKSKTRRSSWFTWLVLSNGLMAFAGGSILCGWSLVTMRSELWLIGVPASLIGIACLLVGFVLQLESLWSGHRETMTLLTELEERMADIRHATTMLSSSHSGAAQSFYAHLVDGASPQVLLADLKSQLDLLAQQMANDSRRAA